MKQQYFSLLGVKNTDKHLEISYLYEETKETFGIVKWSKDLHEIPKPIIRELQGLSMFVANISGLIPYGAMARHFGNDIDFSIAETDKLDKYCSVKTLPLSEYGCLLNIEVNEVKMDEMQHSCQIGYEARQLPYRGKVKVKTPKICIDAEIEKQCTKQREKFPYALYALSSVLRQYIESIEDYAFSIAISDLKLKKSNQLEMFSDNATDSKPKPKSSTSGEEMPF